MPKRPGGDLSQDTDAASRSQTFPVLTMLPDLLRKGFAIPAVVTVIAAFSMSFTLMNHDYFRFISILGCYLVFLAVLAVYALCGLPKPWWCLAVVGALTALVVMPDPNMQTPNPVILGYVARPYLALLGSFGMDVDVDDGPSSSLLVKFFQTFFVVGVLEEGTKIFPVAILALLAYQLRRGPKGRIGSAGRWLERRMQHRLVGRVIGPLLVREPLDGILLATASAAGFELLETLGLYLGRAYTSTIRSVLHDDRYQTLAEMIRRADPADQENAMDLLHMLVAKSGILSAMINTIMRTIDSPFAHIAFTGCIGYAVGLAVIRPASAVRVVLVGAAAGIGLHSAWDAIQFQYEDPLAHEVGVAVVSLMGYALLGTMILKARKISPNRSLNFATVVRRPAAARGAQTGAARTSAAAGFAPAGFVLQVGHRRLPLVVGTQLTSAQLGGAAGSAPVAEVSRNPADPRITGLRNLTAASWAVWLPDGRQAAVDPQRSVRLQVGSRLVIDGREACVEAG